MARDAQVDPRGTGNAELIADPANPLYKVNFKHIATGQKVSFTAWVTDFSDNFSSTWNEESTYGRMDPLVTFQGTQRNISMGLDVVAANKFEAINNTAKVDKLLRFLYPVYESAGQAFRNTLKSPPLLEMEWVNFAADSGADGADGLVGFIRNLNYTPTFESGLFINSPDAGRTNLFPQQLRLQFDFKVIHTHLVGWTDTTFGGPNKRFPHDAGDETSNTDGRPCRDGPWIPDSAINTSQNQRNRRLMAEEQAQNRTILGGIDAGGGARIRMRNQLEANQGYNYNAGCTEQNTVGHTPQSRFDEQRQINEAMAEQRGSQRSFRTAVRTGLRADGLGPTEIESHMAGMRDDHRLQRRARREVIQENNQRLRNEYSQLQRGAGGSGRRQNIGAGLPGTNPLLRDIK